MDQAQLIQFQQQLQDLRAALLAENDTLAEAAKPVELDQASVGRLSRMDAMQGQAMAQETQRRNQRQLQRIASALKKIENHGYGICQHCDENIDPRRLKFDPATPLCLHCANQQETS